MRFSAGGSDDVDLVVVAVVIDSNIKKSLNNFDEFHQLRQIVHKLSFFFAFDFFDKFSIQI